MKILLDCSPSKIKEYSQKYDYEFWQLRTPLTRYAVSDIPWALDNGCFAEFRENDWRAMLKEARQHPPLWACAPDMVGDARRTLDMFNIFYGDMLGVPKALVLQDGIGNYEIPWNRISCVFVGGSDDFKISKEAINACKLAKLLKKWVHVGRVNTAERARNWIGIADSIDGSGMSRFDARLEEVLQVIKGDKQHNMELI